MAISIAGAIPDISVSGKLGGDGVSLEPKHRGSKIVDSNEQFETYVLIKEIENILGSGVFETRKDEHPLLMAAISYLLINMRQLMYKAEKFSSKVSFDEDVYKTGKVNDVSSLIKHARDAVCHLDSANHDVEDGMTASFTVMRGKGVAMEINNYKQESLYDDDLCLFFGLHGIYLNRHIIRAYEEAKISLRPKMDSFYRF